MRIEMFGATDVGRVRKSNQDSFYCNAEQRMAVVADGIGGRSGGEVASRMAVEGIRKAFIDIDSLRQDEISPFLISTIDRVNAKILESGESRGTPGMGTTLNALFFAGDHIHLAHLGDSRTYLFYQGQLWQLTIDHNLKTFIERGWLPESERGDRSREEALVKSLGLAGRCEIDIYDKKIMPGELYLSCSDGLSGMVEDRKIAALIRENLDNAESLPSKLIDEANRAGGRDNITVVVAKVS